MEKIQPIRETHDLIGNDILLYKYIRKVITEMADNYDYNEIETPIFESSELFKKPLGEFSDVVLKEKGRLIIVPRETPFNSIHLNNLLKEKICHIRIKQKNSLQNIVL